MILIDGDVIAYRCAYKSRDDRAEYACYSAGSFLSEMISHLYTLIDDEPEYRVFLTGKGNFRHYYAVTAKYKGNRDDKEKPEHLQAIRDYFVSDWEAVVSDNEEADDLIAIAMTENPGSIILSTDKDFDQIPGKHYNPTKQELYSVTEDAATRFLYEQILMGDRVDNIIGLKGVGPVKAKKALAGLDTEVEMYNKCVEMYEDEERVLENARLLFLRRKPGQIWEPPCAEH